MKKLKEKSIKRILRLINKRLKRAEELEKEDGEASLKVLKNDELIKIANFVLGLNEEKKEKEESRDVRFILDGEIEEWSK